MGDLTVGYGTQLDENGVVTWEIRFEVTAGDHDRCGRQQNWHPDH